MEYDQKLLLIDSNSRRRAAICHMLAQGKSTWNDDQGGGDSGNVRYHTEPFEDVREFIARWPQVGTVLVEDGNDTIPHLLDTMTRHGVWMPVVGFAEQPRTHRIVQAMLEGAIDYLEWPFGLEDITVVLQAVENGAEKVSSLKMREAQARNRVQKLTKREREVLAGVAGGLSNRLIGERLAISPRTVEIHRANMLHKMGAHHTSDAIRIAIEAAISEVPQAVPIPLMA